jgi:2-polyprenyl-3-methyl-5-hydroxy-6-metoxy-1,4-benzoquinol methylase
MSKINYFEKYLTTCFGDYGDYKASYRFFEGDYGAFLPKDKEAVILDIGCGRGEFITYLNSKGYTKVSGVDASVEMVDFCKKNGIVNVSVIDDLKHYLLQHIETFDLITLNDTIEHFPKQEAVDILKAIKSSLKNGGLLLVRTGNFSTLGGAYLRYKDFTHEIAYTEFSLEQTLRLGGFDNIKIVGNKYYMIPKIWSILRIILLRFWFLILKIIYLIELGSDRPKIYSKLLIAICKK